MQWFRQITIIFLAGSACLSFGVDMSDNKQAFTPEEEEEPEESALLQVKKDMLVKKDMSGGEEWYNIEIKGGVEKSFLTGTTPKFLSTTESGDNVDLYNVDSGNGRQRWTIERVGNQDYFHIRVSGGVEDNLFGKTRTYLSATSNAENVDLHTEDDGSGRQHWLITHADEGYHIRIGKGVYDDDDYYDYLSATKDGGVDLYYKDDGSGRQVWQIPNWILPPKETPPPLDPYADWCKEGIRSGKVCCDKRCGTCGGKGCGKRFRHSAKSCCGSNIMGSGPQCSSPADVACHYLY